MTTIVKTVCLFEGRHELPSNEGALCSSFDFSTKKAIKTALWEECLNFLGYHPERRELLVYVTGLTPALTEFIKEATGRTLGVMNDVYAQPHNLYYLVNSGVTLMHYDSSTGEYWAQAIL